MVGIVEAVAVCLLLRFHSGFSPVASFLLALITLRPRGSSSPESPPIEIKQFKQLLKIVPVFQIK